MSGDGSEADQAREAKIRAKTSRLGQSLAGLIGEVEGAVPSGTGAAAPGSGGAAPAPGAVLAPVSDIRRNPQQPRRTFGERELEELAESIRTQGLLQAILVRPDPEGRKRYQIVAGERRWRAAQRAGLAEIPVIVREANELELLELGIVENVQRENLNPLEEARAYRALTDRFGRTQEGLAAAVGKSRAHIANTMRLLALPGEVQDLVSEGRLSAGHGRALIGCDDAAELAERAVEENLSVRQTETLARESKTGSAAPRGGGNPPVKRGKPPKDTDTLVLEADVTRALGLAVSIEPGPGGGEAGELRISYSTLEQLDQLCRKLSQPR